MKLTKRKYSEIDYMRIPFSVAPFATAGIILLGVITDLVPSLSIFVTANFVDTATAIFNGAAERSAIYRPLALLAAIMIYGFLTGTLKSIFNFRLGRRLTVAFRTEVVKKRGSLAYRYIEDNDTWDLISRTAGNCESNITNGFNNILGFVNIVIQAASVVSIVFFYSWISGAILAVFIIPALIIAVRNGRREYSAWKDAEKIRRKSWVYGGALGSREAVEERTMFGFSDTISKKWFEQYDKARKLEAKASFISFMNNHGMMIAAMLVCGVSIGLMLYTYSTGAFSSGTAIGLITGIISLTGIFSWNLAWIVSQFVKTHKYLADLTKFVALDDEDGALDKPKSAPVEVKCIEFKDVTFAYPGTETRILDGMSFRMEGNKTYAFVGVNGAGKTTLIKLLTGLYKDYSGEILINGKELKSYTYSEIKSMFTVVYQDFAKYEVSLAECISLGNVNGSGKDKIENAIKSIDLEGELSRFPNGLDTNLGKTRPDGTDVSGGQWQRIALARSLLSPAPVRVLDEPTSALDPIAEAKIYELFGRTEHDVMTLLITHRLGAARMADEILVVADGRIAESGAHDALMDNGGVYADMFDAQRSWYQ